VGLELAIGLAIALALAKQRWARDLTRSMLLAPMFITPIAVGLIFRFLLNDQIGAIPHLLQAVGVDYDFFGQARRYSRWPSSTCWQWTPFMVLLLLAGLESIPREPLEAARVDGARGWYVLRRVDAATAGAGTRGGDPAALSGRDEGLSSTCSRPPVAGPEPRPRRCSTSCTRPEFSSFRLGSASSMAFIVLLLVLTVIVVAFPAGWTRPSSHEDSRTRPSAALRCSGRRASRCCSPWCGSRWPASKPLSNSMIHSCCRSPRRWTGGATCCRRASRRGGRSAIVALACVAISVVVGSMGAYAIARYRAGGTATRFGMLAAQVLPPAVLVFPFLTMAYAPAAQRHPGPRDLRAPEFRSARGHLVPDRFFEAVPQSLEEQAQVDGFTRFQAFRLVVLPRCSRHGGRGHLRLHLSWNDLFYGLILAPGKAAILPVAIAGFTPSVACRSAR